MPIDSDNIRNVTPPPKSLVEQHQSKLSKLNVPNEIDNSEKVGVRQSYMRSLRGILRIALILTLTAGWISAAATPKNLVYLYQLYDLNHTRNVYIGIAVTADIISIAFFLLFLLNVDNVKPMTRVNFSFIVLILDILFLLMMLGLGIACSVKETLYSMRRFQPLAVNRGSFAAAAFFAYLAMILYLVSVAVELRKTLKIRSANISNEEDK